jgi:hypothetical protein
MDKDQERIEKISALDETFQELYGAPESGALMYEIFQKFKLTEDVYQRYAEIIGDVILGLHKTTDMPRLFQQKLGVSADESQKITSELLEFLSPVVAREAKEASTKKEELGKLQETFSQPSAPLPPDIGHTENVKQIRTMGGDINRIHGYGAYREENPDDEATVISSQEDILSKE